jgi:thiol-disulfide isomerase/thioredoxin
MPAEYASVAGACLRRILKMHRTSRAALVALLALFAVTPAFADDKVEVKVMKYADLKKLITDNKGKVIVVDFWQDFCLTCKKEMPKLIELKKKYGDDLIAVTVNLDDPNDAKLRERNEKTLQAKKATNTINVLLDEKVEDWQKNLKVESFPTIFVYNQSGTYEVRYPIFKLNPKTGKDEELPFDYTDVAKVVADLLKK